MLRVIIHITRHYHSKFPKSQFTFSIPVHGYAYTQVVLERLNRQVVLERLNPQVILERLTKSFWNGLAKPVVPE